MKYINLPKPHGFLIWKQKQKAIGSLDPLLSGESLVVISEGEAFGEAILGEPVEMELTEFKRYEEQHLIRPEEIRLHWPDATKLYVQWIADWQPYQKTKSVCIQNGDCEFDELIEPDEAQKELLGMAERLPKTLVLLDNAVVLEGDKAIISDGLDADKIRPVLDATFNGANNGDASLSLYQLALVRVPRLQLKKKEVEVVKMPDEIDTPAVESIPLDKFDEAVKAAVERILTERKWGDGGDSREEQKAEDDAGYLVTGEEGNHLPTKKNGKLDHRLMGAAWAALHSGFRGNKYEGPGKAAAIAKLKKLYEAEDMPLPSEGEKAGRRMAGRMVDKLKSVMSLLQELMGYAAPEEEEMEMMEEMPEGMMDMMGKGLAIKQVDGKPWLVTYSTNAFRDREKEIFSTKALEKYVTEAESSSDKGTFNLWHIPGSDFAKKEWQAVVGRFLIEAGPFLDNELGQKALAFFTDNPDGHKELAPEGWGCSPEYRYLPEERKSGVYENIWITKTSVLPRLAAANIWTKGSIEMVLSEQQKAAAVKIFGEDLTAQIVKGAEDATKDLEQAGIAHKSTETTEVVIDVDAVANALSAKMAMDFKPYEEALQVLGQQVADLGEKFKSFQKSEDVKQNIETPRFILQMTRASDAKSTALAEDDALKNKKPVEAVKSTDNSGAAHFFPAR